MDSRSAPAIQPSGDSPLSQNSEEKRIFILLRYVLITAAAYLLLFEGETAAPVVVVAFIAGALATNVFLTYLQEDLVLRPFTIGLIVCTDICWIVAGLWYRGSFGSDIFFLYFLILFLAAIEGNLVLILGASVLLTGLDLALFVVPVEDKSIWTSSSLIRVPFVFTVALSHGHLVERVRRERRHALMEKEFAERMARAVYAQTMGLQQQAEELQTGYERVQNQAAELERANKASRVNLERMQALQEINQAITSTLDLNAILDILLKKIDLLLPYSATTIRLFNNDSGLLEPVTCRNLDEKEWKVEKWKAGRGPANVVFTAKAPVMVTNIQTDPQIRDPEFFRKHGLVSYLGVPLIVKDDILGVLSFYTKEAHEFSKEEMKFLNTLAGQAAIAIHNSQLYEEMADLAGDLAKSNRIKDEFLSVMSHELRTPLNVVMGYTGMVKDRMLGEINQQQGEALGKVLTRSRDLLSMITSILQVTSIEADEVKVESHVVSLVDFLSELRSTYEVPLDKEVTLVWDYSSELPVLSTDSAKLKQILQNLINNAIKFTEKGHVIISVRYFHEAKSLEIKVADTGIGISKEMLPVIFDKFYQVDSSETRRYGGVGLGLYIVKKFTELLGGKVGVESELNKGSIFTVTIPQNDQRKGRTDKVKKVEALSANGSQDLG